MLATPLHPAAPLRQAPADCHRLLVLSWLIADGNICNLRARRFVIIVVAAAAVLRMREARSNMAIKSLVCQRDAALLW